MWSAELAHQIRLASPGGGRVKQPSPRPLPLAGFALTTVGRFSADHEAAKRIVLQIQALGLKAHCREM